MSTINSIAREFNAEPFEVEQALDIKMDDWNAEITEYTEAEITEIFTALAELAADRD